MLTVRDIEATNRFYTSVLGMRKATFGEQRINLHEAGKEFEPKAMHPTPGAADLCFLTDTPIEDVVAHLWERSVSIAEGPVERTGATGPILSIYVRDPDGNLISRYRT